jgi:hemolysin activation/secretion protein
VSLSYTELAFNDRQDAVAFVNDARQRIAGIGVAVDARDRIFGDGVSSLQAQYLSGRVLFDNPALAELDASPAGLGLSGRFSAIRLHAQRLQILDPTSSLLFSLNGQLASKNLDAGSELTVGGPQAVRAYPVGELYADQGIVARVEYRKALGLFDTGRSVFSLFVDGSRATVNRNPLPTDTTNERSLSGYGFGIYHEPAPDLRIQTWFAWRASDDRPLAAPDRHPRVWAALSAQF